MNSNIKAIFTINALPATAIRGKIIPSVKHRGIRSICPCSCKIADQGHMRPINFPLVTFLISLYTSKSYFLWQLPHEKIPLFFKGVFVINYRIELKIVSLLFWSREGKGEKGVFVI